MTQLCAVSTPLAALTLAAAVDAGELGSDHRVLLSGGPVPEGVASRFDEVFDWTAEFAPMHAAGWSPRQQDLPVLEHWLHDRWRLRGPLELVVDSIAEPPGWSLAAIFSDALITVCAASLHAYGPTPDFLPEGAGSRLTRLLHLDLLPGLRPLVLREYGLPTVAVPSPFSTVGRPGDGIAVIVGQDLCVELLTALAARSFKDIRYGPGPVPVTLRAEASRRGVTLTEIPGPVELWCAAERPELVVGCVSDTLAAVERFLAVPVASMDARRLLGTPDHIPAVITDALLPSITLDGAVHPPTSTLAQMRPLLRALAYTSQTGLLPELRDDTARYLGHPDALHPYFSQDRIAALDLPAPGLAGRMKHLLRTERP